MTETHSSSDGERLSARCLCGSVRFSAAPVKAETGVCHCGMCQRWAAGPFFAVDCGDSVVIESGDDLERYGSSEWGERGFCRKCGASLFWNMKGHGAYQVSLAAFETRPDVRFTSEIFIDEKPHCYDFANDTEKLTGEQVFALFAAGQEESHD
ncbi:GFA family protein [Hoeflea prorocentri]|uniref:GFA family protein n=1 Tax=Hoeflea prorocentri TaxID=1922333 RepID=A0A9X3UGY7_9HYPH|nr:GFA family protein [Hoeflea prorocentri]MCY6380454.1 GFA family protein [Hoeflea prorocentri]MDA5398254.1 GFA family protein [Hoeflea prorocentri]